jgi:hypothetical protein
VSGDTEELRRRFLVLHGERRTEAAFRSALLTCSREVWRLAVENIERKRNELVNELAKAVQTADDWRAICEGLTYATAEALAGSRPPRVVTVYGNDGNPRILFSNGGGDR